MILPFPKALFCWALLLVLGCKPSLQQSTPTPTPSPASSEACLTPVPVGDGPAPSSFDGPGDLLSIDIIGPAFDAGQSFYVVDSRPPADFALHTISGAYSLPYYDTQCVSEFPLDAWIITFCGCPHSLSLQVLEAFKAAGHSKVKALDEGYFEWRAQGYSTTDNP